MDSSISKGTGTPVRNGITEKEAGSLLVRLIQNEKVCCFEVAEVNPTLDKENLMAELDKMRRTAARVIPDAPHEVFLVLDATTGQNGLEQARKFTESGGVTGIVLTKLDGTAKGGVAIAIARELNLPIRYIGVGEQVTDLLPFNAETYIASLFD